MPTYSCFFCQIIDPIFDYGLPYKLRYNAYGTLTEVSEVVLRLRRICCIALNNL